MNLQEVVSEAVKHGNDIGQTALAEFILKSYRETLSPELISFLERLSNKCCSEIGTTVGIPSEDVALEVSRVMERTA